MTDYRIDVADDMGTDYVLHATRETLAGTIVQVNGANDTVLSVERQDIEPTPEYERSVSVDYAARAYESVARARIGARAHGDSMRTAALATLMVIVSQARQPGRTARIAVPADLIDELYRVAGSPETIA